jgi:hypothetical protein
MNPSFLGSCRWTIKKTIRLVAGTVCVLLHLESQSSIVCSMAEDMFFFVCCSSQHEVSHTPQALQAATEEYEYDYAGKCNHCDSCSKIDEAASCVCRIMMPFSEKACAGGQGHDLICPHGIFFHVKMSRGLPRYCA